MNIEPFEARITLVDNTNCFGFFAQPIGSFNSPGSIALLNAGQPPGSPDAIELSRATADVTIHQI